MSVPLKVEIFTFLGHVDHFRVLIWWMSVHSSIGNFFFAGARIFFQSLDAAIFLYSRVSHIPTHSLVLPAICTNDRLTLGCELHVCIRLSEQTLRLFFLAASEHLCSTLFTLYSLLLLLSKQSRSSPFVIFEIAPTTSRKLTTEEKFICCLQNGTVIRGQNAISHPLVRDTAGCHLNQAINKVRVTSCVIFGLCYVFSSVKIAVCVIRLSVLSKF